MNLDFSDKWDETRFKRTCENQRKIATKWVAYDEQMGRVEEFGWRMGPWSLRFALEVWRPEPMWHGSAATIRVIWKRMLLGREASIKAFGADIGRSLEIPEEYPVETKEWEPEVFEMARHILGEIFGPILRPGDDHQQARETTGLLALHWEVPYEGPKFWLEQQH